MKNIILLVEDDTQLGQTLRDFFECNDFFVLWAKDGNSAIRMFEQTPPSIILLDVELPYKNGFEIATEIRKSNNKVPIIFMTGTALSEKERIDGYHHHHAANYLEKPVMPQVVLAQIISILQPPSVKKYKLCDFTIVIDNQLLIINKEKIQLREKEIGVFTLLLDNINNVVEHKDILDNVWHNDNYKLEGMLNTTISRIKKKLKNFPSIKIKSIYASGYIMEITS